MKRSRPPRPEDVGPRGEAVARVERERRGVLLADVELDPPAVALAGALERRLDERRAQAAAPGAGLDEEVLEPAVLGGVPDAEAVAQLADPGGRGVVVRRAEQELGVRALDQPLDRARNALSARASRAPSRRGRRPGAARRSRPRPARRPRPAGSRAGVVGLGGGSRTYQCTVISATTSRAPLVSSTSTGNRARPSCSSAAPISSAGVARRAVAVIAPRAIAPVGDLGALGQRGELAQALGERRRRTPRPRPPRRRRRARRRAGSRRGCAASGRRAGARRARAGASSSDLEPEVRVERDGRPGGRARIAS